MSFSTLLIFDDGYDSFDDDDDDDDEAVIIGDQCAGDVEHGIFFVCVGSPNFDAWFAVVTNCRTTHRARPEFALNTKPPYALLAVQHPSNNNDYDHHRSWTLADRGSV